MLEDYLIIIEVAYPFVLMSHKLGKLAVCRTPSLRQRQSAHLRGEQLPNIINLLLTGRGIPYAPSWKRLRSTRDPDMDQMGGEAPLPSTPGEPPAPRLAHLLDAMAFAAFHLDAGRRLLFASQRGRAMLAEGRLLREEAGRVVAALPADESCLDEALGEATRTLQSAPVRLGGRARPLSLGCVLPLGGEEAALVLATPGEEGRPMAGGMAAAWFGLTPTEARLAGLLAQGRSLQEVGEQLRISLGTARTHLKSIFLKTGASRQSELVRLLNLLPVATEPATADAGPKRGDGPPMRGYGSRRA